MITSLVLVFKEMPDRQTFSFLGIIAPQIFYDLFWYRFLYLREFSWFLQNQGV